MQKHFEKRLRLNNQIRESQVQVIDADGKQLGVMPTNEALRLANERELDLVEVGPSAKPPIAKIIDYGKYMYQKEKRDRGSKTSKAPGQEIKTVRLGFTIGGHDMLVRSGQADKFIKLGHRVRIEMPLRGREKSMSNVGREKMESFLKLITEPFAQEEPVKRAPFGLGVLISPEKRKSTPKPT
ncbi:MAG: translation initiation factor IF-3 [Candidatus Yanofskybacteria bacterium]|nr:translation initiation factor IF-3 [Candidatus Yanofskybacteria bacterium]